MRNRRAIIYDDEPVVLHVLRDFFEDRGYDVLAFSGPVVCPIYHSDKRCSNNAPCGDIMLTDFRMPGMNGIELLKAQTKKGCRLTAKNKALLTGYMDEGSVREVVELGAAFFPKPVPFDKLNNWVSECEGRMDLSLPLGLPRKEDRLNDGREISYTVSLYGDAVCRGAIVNLSPSGLCVRVTAPLARQATITIRTPLPILSPIALVRWLTDAGDGAYLAGLQCVPQP